MYTEQTIERLNEVLENEEVVNRLAQSQGAEELSTILAEEGVEISSDDIEKITKKLETVRQTGEFDEETLEAVSGGGAITVAGLMAFGPYVAAGLVTAYVVFKVGKWIVDKKHGK